ncbi:MAG: FtsW/RodA/SpoVE family cell cycle protein, partial [Actinomycetota bacterium]
MTEPRELDAVTARRLIGAGELSPVELLDSCLEQIGAVDPAVNAMVVRADDRARAEAEDAAAAVAAGEELGLLGATAVLAAFMFFVSSGFRVAASADAPFEKLLAAGLTALLGFQA